MTDLQAFNDEMLVAADAAESGSGLRPIDVALLSPVAEIPDPTFSHLHFEIHHAPEVGASTVNILLATPELFEAVSGMPAQAATSSSDGFGGWRLP
jgi:hypothetical protein